MRLTNALVLAALFGLSVDAHAADGGADPRRFEFTVKLTGTRGDWSGVHHYHPEPGSPIVVPVGAWNCTADVDHEWGYWNCSVDGTHQAIVAARPPNQTYAEMALSDGHQVFVVSVAYR